MYDDLMLPEMMKVARQAVLTMYQNIPTPDAPPPSQPNPQEDASQDTDEHPQASAEPANIGVPTFYQMGMRMWGLTQKMQPCRPSNLRSKTCNNTG
jgi:hypothetical protein